MSSVPRAPVRVAAKRPAGLGRLPEWNLADLYPGIDAPEVKRDLDRADSECAAFAEAYRGKLAVLATSAEAGRVLAVHPVHSGQDSWRGTMIFADFPNAASSNVSSRS